MNEDPSTESPENPHPSDGSTTPQKTPTSVLKRAKHWLATNEEEGDAPRWHVVLYSIGNIESAIADRLPEQLKNILVVAFHMNPMVVGLIYAIKTLWDGITDPVMAQLTDNARTRWGRRIPFIFTGGISRVVFLALFFYFLPAGMHLSNNPLMEAQKWVNEGSRTLLGARAELNKIRDQIDQVDEKGQGILLDIVEEYDAAEGKRSLDQAREDVVENLPVLREDLAEREAFVETRRQEARATYEELGIARETAAEIRRVNQEMEAARRLLKLEEQEEETDAGKLAGHRQEIEALESELSRLREARGIDEEEYERIRVAQGRLAAAEDKFRIGKRLIVKGENALREYIGAEVLTDHILQAYGDESGELADPAAAQAFANAAFHAAGTEPFSLFDVEPDALPVRSPKKGVWEQISEGVAALMDPVNAEQKGLFLYILIGVLIFTTLTTMQSVPSYALGIEICPSYNGRTQVVVFRDIFGKVIGLFANWLPVLVFSLVFLNAKDGLSTLAMVALFIGIPTTVLMCWFVREKTEATVIKKRPNLFRSMWEIAKIPEFLRVVVLFLVAGWCVGLVQMVGFYLNVYWVMGSALSGATLAAWLGTISWGLGLFSLPLIKWGCDRFEKHRVLAFAFILVGSGNLIAWWAITPEAPWRQAILPFFFSLGIGSVYTVLPTMMADATDLDEYLNGTRREGMFGAVLSFIMKLIGTMTPFIAGLLVTISGFQAELEYQQAASTIFNMRLIVVFVPFSMAVLGLILLLKYPLNRERVNQIKAELKERHAQLKAEKAEEGLTS